MTLANCVENGPTTLYDPAAEKGLMEDVEATCIKGR